jgi:hypothetical protein
VGACAGSRPLGRQPRLRQWNAGKATPQALLRIHGEGERGRKRRPLPADGVHHHRGTTRTTICESIGPPPPLTHVSGFLQGWGESSLLMTERILAGRLGLPKPEWLNEDYYRKQVVQRIRPGDWNPQQGR